jgi:hypothetical protein
MPSKPFRMNAAGFSSERKEQMEQELFHAPCRLIIPRLATKDAGSKLREGIICRQKDLHQKMIFFFQASITHIQIILRKHRSTIA